MGLATLDLTTELFIQFAKACKHGPPRFYVVKENSLPDDAEVVRVRLSHNNPNILQLVIESTLFPDVPEGAEIPELPLVMFEVCYQDK